MAAEPLSENRWRMDESVARAIHSLLSLEGEVIRQYFQPLVNKSIKSINQQVKYRKSLNMGGKVCVIPRPSTFGRGVNSRNLYP